MDCSRRRRLVGPPAKLSWYARYRTIRFAHSDFQPHGKKQKMQDIITEVSKLLDCPRDFNVPYPMGVFGTLRKDCGNHRLMHGGHFHATCKGFMPNFIASGITLHHRNNSSAPFEIYFYKEEEWNKMIKRVDALEGFHPGNLNEWGYYRTLTYLHILPDDFEHEHFNSIWGKDRDLGIPTSEWEKYEKIPCWVYSNKRNNSLCNGYPIIWG